MFRPDNSSGFFYFGLFSLVQKSHTTTPALTEIFRECLVPNWGISITESLAVNHFLGHAFYLITENQGVGHIRSHLKIAAMVWPCQPVQLKLYEPHASLSLLTTSMVVCSLYSQSTLSVAPSAVLWISLWGGLAVIPHK